MTEPWLGHWDGCSVQYSSVCDCDPDNPIDLTEADAEADFFEVQEENYQAGRE